MMRNARLWLPGLLRQAYARRRRALPPRPWHVWFCIADHYEPLWGGASAELAGRRVQTWCRRYPEIAARHADSDGRTPRHTFFYPAEEYRPELLEPLAGLCRAGHGAVEVHLHHDRDDARNLERVLRGFAATLHERHGLLRRDPRTGQVLFAFVHGNWALDNARPDGRWCGVNDELSVLARAGCRVDMTLPSAPSPTQTRKVNAIYFARSCPGRARGHDRGRDVAVGGWRVHERELLLLQGPLALDWRRRKGGLLPRIENGELSADNPPAPHRVELWVRCGIGVRGAEGHLFVKVHTHGAQERTMAMLLGGGLESLWRTLEARFRDAPGWRLHYVTAWEMYEAVRALATGGPAAVDGLGRGEDTTGGQRRLEVAS